MAKKLAPIGEVTHVYSKIGVAIVKFLKPVSVGETIRIKGHSEDFVQTVDSMQYDHKPIEKAAKGQEVGIKIGEKVHEGDKVYLEE